MRQIVGANGCLPSDAVPLRFLGRQTLIKFGQCLLRNSQEKKIGVIPEHPRITPNLNLSENQLKQRQLFSHRYL